MMKRPRSFIATLLALLCLALAPVAGLVLPATVAHAALTTRLMNPRAGDPDEPGDGLYNPGSSDGINQPSDPSSSVQRDPVPLATFRARLRSEESIWDQLLSWLFGFFLRERG